jgi:hypothetical protein
VADAEVVIEPIEDGNLDDMVVVVDAGGSENVEVSPTVVEALWDDGSDGSVANASDIVELLFL